MDNHMITRIAMEQTAVDYNCTVDDLASTKNVVVISRANTGAKRYLQLPFFCSLVSYGSNVVASVDERIAAFISRYINERETEYCFETPALYLLAREFEKFGQIPCFMAEYFLPDREALKALPCPYPIEILGPEGFSHLYTKQWENALCANRRSLDMLAAVAYDGARIVGMAGCSADCATMWQIGVDVLSEYRRKGAAGALTSRLALEILARGKVPFYCCAWSNIKSVGNALKCGFRPAWVNLTSVPIPKALSATK